MASIQSHCEVFNVNIFRPCWPAGCRLDSTWREFFSGLLVGLISYNPPPYFPTLSLHILTCHHVNVRLLYIQWPPTFNMVIQVYFTTELNNELYSWFFKDFRLSMQSSTYVVKNVIILAFQLHWTCN